MATCLLLTIQCSWTPEVETPIHESQKGRIVLQTSRALLVPPTHPQTFSMTLMKQILGGISQTQKMGILQEVFLSDSAQLPIFSRAQVAFLAPHLVEALSQATPEELIAFRSAGDEDGAIRVSGAVAIFSPSIFFLTLQNPRNYLGNQSKIATSSRNLQQHTTLMFSEAEAILQPQDAQRFMKISSQDSWIAIDYAALRPSTGNNQKEEPQRTFSTNSQPEKSFTDLGTIQKQLQDLRNTVDEQAEEIRRLQQNSP